MCVCVCIHIHIYIYVCVFCIYCHVIAHGDEEVRLILSSRVELALSSSQKVTVKRECGSQRG